MSRNSSIAVALGAVLVALLYWVMTRSTCDGMNHATAQLKINKIERALVAYKVSHGEYPQSLEELTQSENGKPALLEAVELHDPWGGTYRYDPSSRHPQTGRPIIFTVSPKRDEISNW